MRIAGSFLLRKPPFSCCSTPQRAWPIVSPPSDPGIRIHTSHLPPHQVASRAHRTSEYSAWISRSWSLWFQPSPTLRSRKMLQLSCRGWLTWQEPRPPSHRPAHSIFSEMWPGYAQRQSLWSRMLMLAHCSVIGYCTIGKERWSMFPESEAAPPRTFPAALSSSGLPQSHWAKAQR